MSAALLTSGRNSVAVFKAQIGVYRNVALIIALFRNTRWSPVCHGADSECETAADVAGKGLS